MAPKDMAATLQRHKAWTQNQYGPGQRADFRGADLRNVNLAGSDLRHADFRAADLSNANLSQADCRNADLRGANLTNSICVGTNFVNARLEGANLYGVDMRTAVLEYSQMAGVNMNSRIHQMLKVTPREGKPQEQSQKRDKGMEM
jgi:uncharacterized protein YjbI with pentapeptide repeats